MKFLKDIFGFLLTFTVFFSVLFAVMNFSSVKSAVLFYVGDQTVSASLSESVGANTLAEIPLAPKGAKKIIQKEFSPLQIVVSPLDYRLIIPKTGTNVPLVSMDEKYVSDDLWGQFENEVQTSLRNGVVHYPGTANPGQFGNAFFTGHSSYYPWDNGNYKDVFANLNKLEVGDEYFVYFQQEKFKYRVISKKEVRPTEVGVLEQSESQKLSTLMTCWPLGTTLRRLIVVSEQVS